MSADNEFERLFREKLGGMETPPPPQSWQRLQETLHGGAAKRRGIAWYWMAAALLFIGLTGGLAWYYAGQGDQGQLAQEPTAVQAPAPAASSQAGSDAEDAKTMGPDDANSGRILSKENQTAENGGDSNAEKAGTKSAIQPGSASSSVKDKDGVTVISPNDSQPSAVEAGDDYVASKPSRAVTSRSSNANRPSASAAGAEMQAATARISKGRRNRAAAVTNAEENSLALNRSTSRNGKRANANKQAAGQNNGRNNLALQQTVPAELEIQGTAQPSAESVVNEEPAPMKAETAAVAAKDSAAKAVTAAAENAEAQIIKSRWSVELHANPMLLYRTITPASDDEWLVTQSKVKPGLSSSLSYMLGAAAMYRTGNWRFLVGAYYHQVNNNIDFTAQRGEVMGANGTMTGPGTMTLRPTFRQYSFGLNSRLHYAGVRAGAYYHPGNGNLFFGGAVVGQQLISSQTTISGGDAAGLNVPTGSPALVGLQVSLGYSQKLGRNTEITAAPQVTQYLNRLYSGASIANVQPYFVGLHIAVRQGYMIKRKPAVSQP